MSYNLPNGHQGQSRFSNPSNNQYNQQQSLQTARTAQHQQPGYSTSNQHRMPSSRYTPLQRQQSYQQTISSLQQMQARQQQYYEGRLLELNQQIEELQMQLHTRNSAPGLTPGNSLARPTQQYTSRPNVPSYQGTSEVTAPPVVIYREDVPLDALELMDKMERVALRVIEVPQSRQYPLCLEDAAKEWLQQNYYAWKYFLINIEPLFTEAEEAFHQYQEEQASLSQNRSMPTPQPRSAFGHGSGMQQSHRAPSRPTFTPQTQQTTAARPSPATQHRQTGAAALQTTPNRNLGSNGSAYQPEPIADSAPAVNTRGGVILCTAFDATEPAPGEAAPAGAGQTG